VSLLTDGPPRELEVRRQGHRVTVYTLLTLSVGLVAGFAIVYHPFDFDVYRWGGQAVSEGMRLYLDQDGAVWFTYPPFAAILFIPIADMPAVISRLAWELASVAALIYASFITLKLAGYRVSWTVTVATFVIGMTLEPMYHTLFLGQINLILLALILADVWRVARGRPAGIGVGIAAAIKLTPLIFIPLFLFSRRKRDGLIATGAFIACVLVGYIVAPGDSGLYWHHELEDTARVGGYYISNQSPYGMAIRVAGGVSQVGNWYIVVPIVLGILGLAAGVILARHNDWLSAAAVTGTTGLLVSPVSWTHHWVWILPALAVLVRGSRATRIAAVFTYLLFAIAPMWFTPRDGGPSESGFHGLLTLVANCYVIAGGLFLAYMCRQAYLALRNGGDAEPEPSLTAVGQGAAAPSLEA
jgi:Glycosyltransferase family 87